MISAERLSVLNFLQGSDNVYPSNKVAARLTFESRFMTERLTRTLKVAWNSV